MTATLRGQTAVITAPAARRHRFRNWREDCMPRVCAWYTSTTERVHLRARELECGWRGVLSFIADLTVEPGNSAWSIPCFRVRGGSTFW